MIHKRSTALELSVEYFTGGLKPVLRHANLTLSSDMDKLVNLMSYHYKRVWYLASLSDHLTKYFIEKKTIFLRNFEVYDKDQHFQLYQFLFLLSF